MFDWLLYPKITVEIACRASEESGTEPREWVISKCFRFRTPPRVDEFLWLGPYLDLNQVAVVKHYTSGRYRKTVVRLKDTILPYKAELLVRDEGWIRL
jgi:hypothetical protein